MAQQLKSKHILDIDNSNYFVKVEEVDGLLFIHLDVSKWSPSVLKDLRLCFYDLLQFIEPMSSTGMVFASGHGDKQIKFWNLIHPLTDLERTLRRGVVGAWDIEDVLNGSS